MKSPFEMTDTGFWAKTHNFIKWYNISQTYHMASVNQHSLSYNINSVVIRLGGITRIDITYKDTQLIFLMRFMIN